MGQRLNILASLTDKFLGKILPLQNKNDVNLHQDAPPPRSREDMVGDIDYTAYPDVAITNPTGKRKLFILDDIPETQILYASDFDIIEKKHNKNIRKDFKIVKALGRTAGFTAHKYLVIEDHAKIDFAMLDLTLGYVIPVGEGEFIEFDGIDVAIDILEKNPDAKIIFLTAHTIDIKNSAVVPVIKMYSEKYFEYTGLDLLKQCVPKDGDRVSAVIELLYSEK